MRRLCGCVCLCLFLLPAAPARAVDLFVNNIQGDDHNNGRAPRPTGARNGPVKSLARALYLAQKADRVILADTGEPYRECVTLQGGKHSGIEQQPFEIVGNGAVLEGLGPVRDEAWEGVQGDVFRFRPTRVAYQTLFFGDQPAPRGASLAELQPGQWTLAAGHLYVRALRSRLPATLEPRAGAMPVGLTLYDVENVVIRDLVVQGFQLDGVSAPDNVRQCDLVNVVSLYNGRSGFSVAGSSRVRLDACQAAGNGAAQARVEGYAIVQIIGGTYDPASAPSLVRDGGQALVERP